MCFDKLILSTVVCLLSISSFSQYKNIKIDEGSGDISPEEPSIAMNFKNTQQLVAGSNLNNVYYSQDGGFTWKKNKLKSKYGVYGDPCIITDTTGNFYFFHLADPDKKGWGSKHFLDRVICQKSVDGGITWSKGTYAGKNTGHHQDKHWAYVDPKTNMMYVSWTQFDKYESKNPLDSSRILFSSSANGGKTWSKPVRINQFSGNCLDSDSTTEGAVPATGPNGEVYVAWGFNNKIYFDKSLNRGKTWMAKDVVASDQPSGWDYEMSDLYRANGMPITECDLSNGPNRGTIYINFSDQRNGKNNTDVWLVKSTDGGNNWSAPLRVNDDTTKKQQFMSWMAIDQTNGNLYVLFYDRRNYDDSTTDVYLATSTDGGKTFKNEKVNEKSFKPVSWIFFGDYINITAHNGIVRPIWMSIEGNGTVVWTAIINK